MTCGRLPIGVLIPTLNANAILPAWLPDLQAVLDLSDEAIVVDSFSNDGTLDQLHRHLRHPRLQWLSHPRGLYQCWNCGIAQLRSKYVYIATVADSISPPGLKYLFETAERLRADVVVSPPEFRKRDGRPNRRKQWPVHRLLERFHFEQPFRLEPLAAFLSSALELPEGILGSSASNLYLAQTLRRFPFPSDFGHLGDTAWALRHAFQISLAIAPRTVSRFITDSRGANLDDQAMLDLTGRLFGLARQRLRDELPRLPGSPSSDRLLCLLNELSACRRKLHRWQDIYDDARKQAFPWILNARAWHARRNRNHQRARIRRLKQTVWTEFCPSPAQSKEPDRSEPKRQPEWLSLGKNRPQWLNPERDAPRA